ncbi:HAD-like domain-containing protein [Thamnocephalis sphaerospora]|uniref:HAD-like domain-containing protein n=1 Tax=Thamnocephalis sphaerospora TaxID=78915 RepID=A0A4P9XWC3_9FUNG|nr:HAD-like domain-containing protein [Thamnocephalis sphaerospora]|eukprot:RKP10617.1 HAD-like domain-containing protein [Thamnocephalis sphaerospora]
MALAYANHAADTAEEDELDIDEFDPYVFMATVPPVPREYRLRPFALPRKTRSSPPITLVLDLDETLVHCSTSPIDQPELQFPVEFNGVHYQVHGRCRPHYREFLERVAGLFEVVVFTASQKSYANRLLDILDPNRKLIKYRLFRDSCVHVCGNYLKDLTILGRDLAQVVIVDNAPQAFAYQLSNGIPIESWYDNPADCELMHVLQFLETLVGQEDVRPRVDKQFRMREIIRQAQLRY